LLGSDSSRERRDLLLTDVEDMPAIVQDGLIELLADVQGT
jgi:hypothetical protein